MKLKSFKTIEVLYVVVSATALLTACNTKFTEPFKLASGQSVDKNQSMTSSDDLIVVDNYGVTQAQSVTCSKNADDESLDFTY